MFVKNLIRSFEAKYFARRLVHQVNEVVNDRLSEFVRASFFGYKSAEAAERVFQRTLFPGGVRMAEISGQAGLCVEGVFKTIVERQRMKYSLKLISDGNKNIHRIF